ncbi:hypothetical protein [Colwellia sp. TT2012]|uniref:hypothetical protein n=1 Tax=Colwellia sp. TT2012 TaxID=1720342 RepID=UPI000B1E264F|nr:hypothetical protein [Colwellia sp. TT2012]
MTTLRAISFSKKYGPRGILHTWASDTYDRSIPDVRFGEIGKQKIIDTCLPDEARLEQLDTEYFDVAFKFL